MNKTFMYLLMLATLTMSTSLYLLLKSTMIMLEYPIMNYLFINMSLNFMLDWTASMFITTVIIITSMIIMFSNSYMSHMEMPRFIPLLLMFAISMIILITSNNLISIIVGWDGLGISSYILVAYYQNFSTSASSTLTILSNRIGDIAMISSISLLIPMNSYSQTNFSFPKSTIILLLLAAMTKSAQFPFSAWLPAAMAAPTPISALVHSSTLVTAGIFLLMRMNTEYHPSTMILLMISSTFTSMMAGMSANWEQDMKKIIALSTLSQIAMMMFSISINANKMAFFHLITHAMFKSTMFMCAGTLISLSSYQDMRSTNNMMNSPIIASTLGMSSMALMGIPFSSGFYSKDLIIEMSLFNYNQTALLLMTMTLGMTCSYSMRMMKKTLTNQLSQKPDSLSPTKNFFTPLSIMNPTSILSGATMSWLFLPEQIIIISFQKKISMITTMLLGMMMGLLTSLSHKKYISMSEFSISLWFNHILSCNHIYKLNKLTNMFQKNDQSWMELYGPQGIFALIKNQSPMYNPISMITLTLMIMLPLSLLS